MEENITGISKQNNFLEIHFLSRETRKDFFQVELRLVKADLKKMEDKTTGISTQINFKMEEKIIGISKHTDFIFVKIHFVGRETHKDCSRWK